MYVEVEQEEQVMQEIADALVESSAYSGMTSDGSTWYLVVNYADNEETE